MSFREECLYRSYQELVQWIPSLKPDLTAESDDYEVRLIMKYVSIPLISTNRLADNLPS